MAVIRNGSTVVGEVFEHSNFAICSTTASTQVKAVSCPLYKSYVGARISIKFTHGSTVGTCVGTDSNIIDPITAPKISINNGTAYPIYVGGEPAGENFISSCDVHDFVFDGERFCDLTATVIYKGGDSDTGYYEKARDGKLEQHGIVKSTATVTIPITYSNVNYNLVVGCYSPTQYNSAIPLWQNGYYGAKTVNTFKVYADTNLYHDWITKGE